MKGQTQNFKLIKICFLHIAIAQSEIVLNIPRIFFVAGFEEFCRWLWTLGIGVCLVNVCALDRVNIHQSNSHLPTTMCQHTAFSSSSSIRSCSNYLLYLVQNLTRIHIGRPSIQSLSRLKTAIYYVWHWGCVDNIYTHKSKLCNNVIQHGLVASDNHRIIGKILTR